MGGYATSCKACGSKVWVPKRGAGRPPAAREAAGRFGARRWPAGRTGRRQALAPGKAAVAELQPEPDDAELWSPGQGVARMIEDIALMPRRRAAGARPQRQPAAPGVRVVAGVVIPPGGPPAVREPAEPAPVDLDGKRPLQVKPFGRPARQPGPEYGNHVTPQGGQWCQLCVMMDTRDRSGHWAQALVRVEILAWGLQAALCRAHRQVVEREARRLGEEILVRLLPSHKGGANGQVVKTAPAARMWCGRCGAAGDPARPGVCPCGLADFVSRSPSGAVSRVRSPALRAGRAEPNATLAVSRSYQ